MTRNDVRQRFLSLSPTEKAKAWVAVAHELTIHARASYRGQMQPDEATRRLRSFNEIQHTIIGQAMKLLSNDSKRYADDALVDISFDVAAQGGCEAELLASFKRVIQSERQLGAKKKPVIKSERQLAKKKGA